MLRRAAVALLALSCALAACKKKKSAADPKVTATPTPSASAGAAGDAASAACATAIDAFTKLQETSMKEFFQQMKESGSDAEKAQAAQAETELAAAAPKLRAIKLARCVADKWSPELLTCMREAEEKNAGACERMFTAEQKQHIEADITAAGIGPKPAPSPPAGQASCADVVAHIQDIMTSEAKSLEEKQAMAPMVEPLMKVMLEQCSASAWSAELRGCLVATQDLEQCDPLFTPEQKAALERGLGGDAQKKQPE